jgi:hypothetical protein
MAPRLRAHLRGPRSVVVLSLVSALALAGCSGGGDTASAPDEAPESQGVADGSTLSGRWPLTGLPADGEAPRHPPMVVKIDNSSNSDPQVGLSKADMVTEELVEGGTTRLAVFYYSQVPKDVGPVRSMRATDIGIVQPADAVLVASGGAPPTVRRMQSAGVKTVTEGGTGYYRDGGRVAPYNLMMNLPKLGKSLKAPEPPANYFPWGSDAAFPNGKKARRIDATFSGGHTTRWRFRGGRYTNVNSYAAKGDQFKPATVLVLRVAVGDAGYLDPAGNPVPETKFTGKGQALVFHDGRVVKGTWRKKGLDAGLTLRTKSGPLELPPGKVWMELVPAQGGNVSFSKK